MRFSVSCFFMVLFAIGATPSFATDAADAEKPPASLHFSGGAYWVRNLSESGGGIAGEIDVSYHFNRRYAIHGDARIAIGRAEGFWGFRGGSLGGRYFLWTGSISPYFGAGLSVMRLEQVVLSQEKRRLGVGVFGAIGIETRRQSKNRYKVQIRLDTPFFLLEDKVSLLDEDLISDSFLPITVGIIWTRVFP